MVRTDHTTVTSGWEPILSGELARSAQSTIETITAQNAKRLEVATPAELCNLALLWSYTALAESSDRRAESAVECLNNASEAISNGNCSVALYGGLSGIGSAFQQVASIFRENLDPSFTKDNDPTSDDSLSAIDQFLLSRLKVSLWKGPYGLSDGLVGIGTYFLERLPRPAAAWGIRLILRHLEELSEMSWGGVTWPTPTETILRENQAPSYNLTVSQGVPGIVAFLGEVLAAQIDATRVQNLLEPAVQWVFGQLRNNPVSNRTHYRRIPAQGQQGLSLAWSYGDLGVAAVLNHTARRVGRPDWVRQSKAILDESLTQQHWKHCDNPSVCCGALGVAHIYNRTFHAEHENRYRDAAVAWYSRGIELLSSSGSTVGSIARAEQASSLCQLHQRVSMPSDATAQALCLISAVSDVEPNWDRLLLLSGCGRA